MMNTKNIVIGLVVLVGLWYLMKDSAGSKKENQKAPVDPLELLRIESFIDASMAKLDSLGRESRIWAGSKAQTERIDKQIAAENKKLDGFRNERINLLAGKA